MDVCNCYVSSMGIAIIYAAYIWLYHNATASCGFEDYDRGLDVALNLYSEITLFVPTLLRILNASLMQLLQYFVKA